MINRDKPTLRAEIPEAPLNYHLQDVVFDVLEERTNTPGKTAAPDITSMNEELTSEIVEKIMPRIEKELTNARREERERILAGIEPLIADLNAAVKTFKKHGMVKTAREMKENIGYLIYLVNGYTAEDALRKVNQEAQSSEEEKV